jgi:nitrate/TMAO reductase-like tetraheme cytochrome c subunit
VSDRKPVPEEVPARGKRSGVIAFLTQPIGSLPVPERHGFRRLLHIPRTPVGIVGGMLLSGFLGIAVMMMLPFSESTTFCTTCHTMIPQEKAHEAGAHADVNCGECHVTPTAEGWVRAKIGGMRELYGLVTNTYPRPIDSPERYISTDITGRPHAAVFTRSIPPVTDSCLLCHQAKTLAKEAPPIKLIVNTKYLPNETNTKQVVSVTLRPSALSPTAADVTDLTENSEQAGVVSVHWHFFKNLKIYQTEATNGPIELVQFTNTKGQVVSFIDASQVGVTNSVSADIQRLENKLSSRPIDCIDCHNRVGHAIAGVDESVDVAMKEGKISPRLPFVKRDATRLVSAVYVSDEAADAAIDKWAARYRVEHPTVPTSLVVQATAGIKAVYHEVATPAMNTNSTTYINNLGHKSGPGTGCWRCHDGKHVRVVDGKLTNQVVPSTCSTCHSFPQIGSEAQMSVLATPPVTHQSNMWVFDHKTSVSSVAAAFTGTAACASCHIKSYCEECHATGAAKVTHDGMLYSHAESERVAGLRACATCHQGSYCAMCHGPGLANRMGKLEARVSTS